MRNRLREEQKGRRERERKLTFPGVLIAEISSIHTDRISSKTE